MDTKVVINKNPPLLSPEVIARAKKLSSSLLSDAMDGLGSMDYTIKPVASGMKVVGTALTVKCPLGDNLMFHKALYSADKGYVITVDTENNIASAGLGELMTQAAIRVGVEGIVTDGLVRDIAVLRGLALPVFSKGSIPNATNKKGPGKINVRCTCGGITVNPGDLIVGDDDGVVVVPRERVEEIIFKAEQKELNEQSRLKEIAEGKIKPDWLKD